LSAERAAFGAIHRQEAVGVAGVAGVAEIG
jgi:hypothetical protein